MITVEKIAEPDLPSTTDFVNNLMEDRNNNVLVSISDIKYALPPQTSPYVGMSWVEMALVDFKAEICLKELETEFANVYGLIEILKKDMWEAIEWGQFESHSGTTVIIEIGSHLKNKKSKAYFGVTCPEYWDVNRLMTEINQWRELPVEWIEKLYMKAGE